MKQNAQERLNELARKASDVSKTGSDLVDRLEKRPGLEAKRLVVLDSLSEIEHLVRRLPKTQDRRLTAEEEAALEGLFLQYEQLNAEFEALSKTLEKHPDLEKLD